MQTAVLYSKKTEPGQDKLNRFEHKAYRFGILLLTAMLLTSCVTLPVPWKGEAPFDTHTLEQLLIPETTLKTDVLLTLGEPDVQWREGQIWLYAGFQKTRHDVINQSSAGKYHYLFLEFDSKGSLRRFDHLIDENCTFWGLCFAQPADHEWSYTGSLGFADQYLVAPAVAIKAPTPKDIAAKRFSPTTGKCSIYVYYDGQIPPPRRPVLCRPDSPCRELKPGSYLHWTQSAGTEAAAYSIGHLRLGIVNIKVVDKIGFETRCSSGERIFTRVSYKLKTWYGAFGPQVEYEDTETGKKSVRKRWLLLD